MVEYYYCFRMYFAFIVVENSLNFIDERIYYFDSVQYSCRWLK
jgi:hypothetical protein